MRTTDSMREVLAPAHRQGAGAARQDRDDPLLRGLDPDPRVSFEVAAKNLSADVVSITASASSVSKGESLVDTVRTVEALGADMLVMRHAVERRAVPRRRALLAAAS